MNVVITGAGKGIGYALARRFAREPAHRVWACSRDVSAWEQAPDPHVVAEALDIVQEQEEGFRHRVAAHWDRVDIVVHNAGLLTNKPFIELTDADWRTLFEVNIFAAAKISRALLPLLRRSDAAHIVHIGSMGGVQGTSKFPGLSAYSAAKAALANLTECLAEELKSEGIHVNCLALGGVNTEMLRQAFPDYTARLSPEAMADFIYDFSVHRRAFFNGKILPVTATTP